MEDHKKKFWLYRVLPALYMLGIGLVSVYLGVRVRSWLNLLLPVETGYVVGAVMLGYFILSLNTGRHYLVARTRLRTYICGVSTFLVIYLSMAVLVSDLIRMILQLVIRDQTSRRWLFIGMGFLCLIFLICVTAAALRQRNRIKVMEAPIHCKNFRGQYRIALLSDLHIGYYVSTRHIQNVVEEVNRLHADMVVISGDMINAGNTRECAEIDRVARELSGLKSREGTFAITGNHDPAVTDRDFQKFLRDARITLLEDDIYTNRSFSLIGRTTRTRPRQPLNRLLEGLDSQKPRFVLDHDPLGVREAVAEQVDLIMCGHTHRGQVFPLNLFCRAMYSKEEFWGQSRLENTNVVVTAGTGYFSMPMRLGSSCEIWSLDIDGETTGH